MGRMSILTWEGHITNSLEEIKGGKEGTGNEAKGREGKGRRDLAPLELS